ncbi:hypothetical protein LSM04_004567 [Trypanosoma melophagium]|uniref:uncharacterized protein n=1 Tax=Trypanosoma melophagium TaxID=715481 RepID=UPI003519ED6B|nr:hypothetical protein LSM04_004567 [Trypanosoma melophagium]
MDAYNSLNNRVASLEELFHRSESAVSVLLQRVKTLEEYVSVSEARSRGEGTARTDELRARLERALESQHAKTEALQNTAQQQAAMVQKVEERLGGFVRAMEQKINSDVGGCLQRIQALESSMVAAVRNLESSVHSQSSAIKSVEQLMRADLQSMQQRISGEIVAARQHVETVENDLRKNLNEANNSVVGDLKNVSENLISRIQSNTETINSSLVGLDQKMHADIRSVQESLAREINVNRQSITAQDAGMRDSLQALHGTLSSDIANLSSRMQTLDAANQVSHQQMLAEMSSQRQQIEMVDSNWRSSLADFNGKVQEGFQNLRALQGAMEVAIQQRVALTNIEIEKLTSELHRATDNLTQMIQVRYTLLDNLRDDIITNKNSLSTFRDEYNRLREDFRGLSMLAERSALQLRSVMEAAVRASHGDLLERIKPLTGYRSEMHSAITAALNKLWSEANATFISHHDIQMMQNQIQVLDNAVRSEVALLADKRRGLNKQSADQKPEVVVESRAVVSGEPRALVQVDVAGELNNVWVELRSLQQRLGVPRDEVIRMVDALRNHVFDIVLEKTKNSEDELRRILVKIQEDVRQMMSQPIKNTDSSKGKKTVVRVLSSNALHPSRSIELPPVMNSKEKVPPEQMLMLKPQKSLDSPHRPTSSAVSADGKTSDSAVKAANRLPPLVHVAPLPATTTTTPPPTPTQITTTPPTTTKVQAPSQHELSP